MTEHEKPEGINEANGWYRIGKSAWTKENAFYDPDHEFFPDYQAIAEREQREYNAALARTVIAAITEDDSLRRELLAALGLDGDE